MKHITKFAAIGVVAAFMPVSASALGITVQTFSGANALTGGQTAYATLRDTFETFTVETFEGFTKPGDLGQITGSLNTAVGSFTTTGGNGTGSSAVGDNNLNSQITVQTPSTNIALRADNDGQNDGGRFNTTFGGNRYLDSNDTNGMHWSIPGAVPGGLGFFDRILFNLVDVADAGRILTISALDQNDQQFFSSFNIASQDNSTVNTVLISFNSLVSFATVKLDNNGRNDGFSIDDATVGAIPLPAAAWLLLAASGGLIVAKRRSARRAA